MHETRQDPAYKYEYVPPLLNEEIQKSMSFQKLGGLWHIEMKDIIKKKL